MSVATETLTKTARPAGAKKPQDRKPKVEPDRKVTVTEEGDGYKVTFRDIELHIVEEATNDYELVEDLAEEDPAKMPGVLRKLFGDDGYHALKEALRNPDTGRITVDGPGSIGEFLTDLFEAINPS